MKIVILGTRGFPNVQGGVETHCEHLSVNLAQKGCDVYVITRKPYIDPRIKQYKGVKLICLTAFKIKSIEAVLHTLMGLFVAFLLRPDILHIQAIGPAIFTPLARLMGMKVVVTSHGSNYRHLKWGGFAKFVLKIGEFMGVHFSNRLIVISNYIHDEIQSKYGKSSIIIPNGISVANKTQQTELLKELNIVPNKYIFAVGRLVPEKGFHTLIDAFNNVGSKDWKLVITGEADHEDEYSEKLKNSAKQNSNIIMTGYLAGDYLHQLYSHAGLFALPSYYEGLPIALLEAMSYGLSCIVSDIQGTRSINLDKDRFFQPGESKSLEDKMRRYMSQPLSSRHAKEQIFYVTGTFDWRRIARKTIQVYKSIQTIRIYTKKVTDSI
ncbi:MAG: glycosyltransferase family 4 protein [Desulfobacteraceae bacterium]|nr:glycosyltransferase family 4 protein [Desulfobacteraceae bacterium]